MPGGRGTGLPQLVAAHAPAHGRLENVEQDAVGHPVAAADLGRRFDGIQPGQPGVFARLPLCKRLERVVEQPVVARAGDGILRCHCGDALEHPCQHLVGERLDLAGILEVAVFDDLGLINGDEQQRAAANLDLHCRRHYRAAFCRRAEFELRKKVRQPRAEARADIRHVAQGHGLDVGAVLGYTQAGLDLAHEILVVAWYEREQPVVVRLLEQFEAVLFDNPQNTVVSGVGAVVVTLVAQVLLRFGSGRLAPVHGQQGPAVVLLHGRVVTPHPELVATQPRLGVGPVLFKIPLDPGNCLVEQRGVVVLRKCSGGREQAGRCDDDASHHSTLLR